MNVEFTWNRPDGTKPVVSFTSNPNDPHRDDEELQIAKAMGAAQAHFNNEFGQTPPPNELSYRIVSD